MSKMSAFEVHHRYQIGTGFLNATLSALRSFADGIAHGRRLYRDYLHLSAMSDPELQDIGISRSDIFAVIAGTYRRAQRPLVTAQKRRSESRSPFRPATTIVESDQQRTNGF